MKLTFLGTGTSFGVPVVGCDCSACTSDDSRDRRTRHGAVVEIAGRRLLVDTPPELRLQLLASGISDIEAVWFTHMHADHVHGIDDVRIFTARGRGDLPAYVASEYRPLISRYFQYIFDDTIEPPTGSSKPRVQLKEIQAGRSVEIIGQDFMPLKVPHGPSSVYGFRVGGLGKRKIDGFRTRAVSIVGVHDRIVFRNTYLAPIGGRIQIVAVPGPCGPLITPKVAQV